MEFRLTYNGLLLGASKTDARARHKHNIRRVFHHQLRRLWEINPNLERLIATEPVGGLAPAVVEKPLSRLEWLSQRFQRGRYEFVPLVTEDLRLLCGVSILFLRPDAPGSLVKSGDIDNRLKTLFDSFRLPKDDNELGGYETPEKTEVPFFCLMEDDRLITKVSVETDTLLEAVQDVRNPNETRLVITVTLSPIIPTWRNAGF